jgi:purine-binding chemotaxis protein CheW
MSQPNRSQSRTRSTTDKYLTFVLGKEHYALPIRKVQEIIGLQEITPVPRLPSFVRGVINLRGKVIPITDLRLKFGMAKGEDTRRTCIVVVQIERTGIPAVTMGVVVDHVSEVQDIPPEQVEPPPSIGSSVDATFINGVAKVAKKVVVLLDIDRLLSQQEIAAAATVAPT